MKTYCCEVSVSQHEWGCWGGKPFFYKVGKNERYAAPLRPEALYCKTFLQPECKKATVFDNATQFNLCLIYVSQSGVVCTSGHNKLESLSQASLSSLSNSSLLGAVVKTALGSWGRAIYGTPLSSSLAYGY
jgi:hypothetical protein